MPGVIILQGGQVGTIVRHGYRIRTNVRHVNRHGIISRRPVIPLHLFAPSLAFVDLETTGTDAVRDRITEVGIVRVDADAAGGPPTVREWSSLVAPGVPIPV